MPNRRCRSRSPPVGATRLPLARPQLNAYTLARQRSLVRLLDADALENSSVVANCRMNRGRRLAGYVRELRLDPLAEALARIPKGARGAWLDLCCGTGRALVDAARVLAERQDARLR